MLRPGLVIIILWVAFWISWFAAAGWSAKTERRVEMKGQLAYRIVLIIGTLAFLPPAHGYHGPMRTWLVTRDQAWACTAEGAGTLQYPAAPMPRAMLLRL